MKFRRTRPGDIEETYAVRAATRQNPISKATLAAAGFGPEAVSERYANGAYVGWVCEAEGRIAGFATGDAGTGEIVVIAVLPEYEGKGIGKALLSRLIEDLIGRGCARLWLEASPDPRVRAHGFYRANGWVPTGRISAGGDEILELGTGMPRPANAAPPVA